MTDATEMLIIEILAHEKCSTAQVHRRIKVLSGLNTSYYTIYDKIKRMVKKGVIKKDAKNFFLDAQWLETSINLFTAANSLKDLSKDVRDFLMHKTKIVTVKFQTKEEYYKCARMLLEYLHAKYSNVTITSLKKPHFAVGIKHERIRKRDENIIAKDVTCQLKYPHMTLIREKIMADYAKSTTGTSLFSASK